MKEEPLEKLLRKAIQLGEIAYDLPDDVVDRLLDSPLPSELSSVAVQRQKQRMEKCREDAAISTAKSKVTAKLSFGRYCEAVREHAGLLRSHVAVRLGTDENFVQRFERGDLDPLTITPRRMADLVELFQAHINLVTEMLVCGMGTVEAKRTYRVAARAHGGIRHDQRTEDVERALDAFTRKMRSVDSDQRLHAKAQTHINGVRDELKRRGRTDLLK